LADEEQAKEYRDAWAGWNRALEDLHAVFLDGQRRPPEQMKGLLNREARAKERYDAARKALLGIEDSPLAF
jgi:hypothetical protein